MSADNLRTLGNLQQLAHAGGRFLNLDLGVGTVKVSFCSRGGARGGIVALACAAPKACLALYNAWSAGDFRKTAEVQRIIAPAAAAVTAKHGIAGLKAAMAIEGFDSGLPRRPLLPVKQAQIEDLKQTFRRMNSELAELS